MKNLEFLLLGKNEAILAILLRLVNADENWNAVAFNNEKEAQEYFQNHKIDIVLLSSGIEDRIEKEFTSFCIKNQPEVEVIEHFGGGSGLLKSEILHRLYLKGKI
jgi:2-hydroxy-3-keto-5-methylthiopentenyl-1-phosphate phosphatase